VLRPPYLRDFIGLGTTRSFDLYGRAFGLADQHARNRRSHGDLALLHVGFWLADYLPNLLLAGIFIYQRHRSPKFDGIARKPRYVDYFRTRELVFQLGNVDLIDFLFRLGSLIFRILSQIGIVGDRRLDSLHEATSLDL